MIMNNTDVRRIRLTQAQYDFAKRRALHPGYLAQSLEEMLLDTYLQGMNDAMEIMQEDGNDRDLLPVPAGIGDQATL